MLFRVGDRVKALYRYTKDCVGEYNIGTILYIKEDEKYYGITWDNKGSNTYKYEGVPNMWNCSFSEVELAGPELIPTLQPTDKNYKVCLKVLQLQSKRENKGYVF